MSFAGHERSWGVATVHRENKKYPNLCSPRKLELIIEKAGRMGFDVQ